MKNYDVCIAWVRGESKKTKSLSTNGTELISYATTIGLEVNQHFYLSEVGMSATTRKHLSYARRAVKAIGFEYTECGGFEWGNRIYSLEQLNHPRLSYCRRKIEEANASIKRRVTPQTLFWDMRDLLGRRAEEAAITGKPAKRDAIPAHFKERIVKWKLLGDDEYVRKLGEILPEFDFETTNGDTHEQK